MLVYLAYVADSLVGVYDNPDLAIARAREVSARYNIPGMPPPWARVYRDHMNESGLRIIYWNADKC